MVDDPRGKERVLEGSFWKAASFLRLRSSLNNPPCLKALIYS
jgi:hypothetical protein